MKTNIALTGFMGVGKTAVAEVLARKLGLKYVSTDVEIEKKHGVSIRSIFENDGEIKFREMEIDIVREISQSKYAVIDCGGGVVLNTINISRLKQRSLIVYLKSDADHIIERLSIPGNVRPVIKNKKIADIIALMKQREPFYIYAADIKINTSKLDIDAAAEKVMKELKKREDFSFKK